MSELLNCPECKNESLETMHYDGLTFFVCEKCGLSADSTTFDKAYTRHETLSGVCEVCTRINDAAIKLAEYAVTYMTRMDTPNDFRKLTKTYRKAKRENEYQSSNKSR